MRSRRISWASWPGCNLMQSTASIDYQQQARNATGLHVYSMARSTGRGRIWRMCGVRKAWAARCLRVGDFLKDTTRPVVPRRRGVKVAQREQHPNTWDLVGVLRIAFQRVGTAAAVHKAGLDGTKNSLIAISGVSQSALLAQSKAMRAYMNALADSSSHVIRRMPRPCASRFRTQSCAASFSHTPGTESETNRTNVSWFPMLCIGRCTRATN